MPRYGRSLTLDRIMSTSFGRPAMIYKEINRAPHPQVIDDQYLSTTTEEGRQPDHVPSLIAHPVYGLKTLDILEDMRSIIATARLKASQAGTASSDPIGPDPSALLRLNSRIDDFLSRAPAQLQPDVDFRSMAVSEEHAICFRIQGKVLRSRLVKVQYVFVGCMLTWLLRMSMMKLLLLRPSVLAEVQRWALSTPRPVQSSAAKLEERLHREVCDLCLSIVHATLEEMHSSLYRADEFPAWHCLQGRLSSG